MGANNKERLGDRVLRLRKEAGMTQRQLAEAVGGYIDKEQIGSIESNSRGIPADNAAAFAQALGVSLTVLMGGEEL